MNEAYAYLLPDAEISFPLFGKALVAVMSRRGHSQKEVHRQTGIDRKTIRAVMEGQRCNADSLLKLCIYMDANPFDTLFKRVVSREYTTPHPEEGEAVHG